MIHGKSNPEAFSPAWVNRLVISEQPKPTKTTSFISSIAGRTNPETMEHLSIWSAKTVCGPKALSARAAFTTRVISGRLAVWNSTSIKSAAIASGEDVFSSMASITKKNPASGTFTRYGASAESYGRTLMASS